MKSFIDWQQLQEEIQSKPSTVLFVSSNDCSVCTAVHAKLEEMEQSFMDTAFFSAKLDSMPRISGLYMVFTVPTVLVFRDGTEVHRESRFMDWKRLEKHILETMVP